MYNGEPQSGRGLQRRPSADKRMNNAVHTKIAKTAPPGTTAQNDLHRFSDFNNVTEP